MMKVNPKAIGAGLILALAVGFFGWLLSVFWAFELTIERLNQQASPVQQDLSTVTSFELLLIAPVPWGLILSLQLILGPLLAGYVVARLAGSDELRHVHLLVALLVIVDICITLYWIYIAGVVIPIDTEFVASTLLRLVIIWLMLLTGALLQRQKIPQQLLANARED